MTESCPHCGICLPASHDAFCPSYRSPLDEEPEGGVRAAPVSNTIPAYPTARNGGFSKVTADWGFGLLAGTLLGFALAMIFVEPNEITPESKASRYVAAVGVVGASGVTAFRNWFLRKGKTRN